MHSHTIIFSFQLTQSQVGVHVDGMELAEEDIMMAVGAVTRVHAAADEAEVQTNNCSLPEDIYLQLSTVIVLLVLQKGLALN